MNEGVVGICRGRHSHLAREEHVESKDSKRRERWSALRGTHHVVLMAVPSFSAAMWPGARAIADQLRRWDGRGQGECEIE